MAVIKYEPEIEVVPNPEVLAQKTVDIFITEVKKAVATKGAFYGALSGGHTPKLFYELLGTLPQTKALTWNKIHLFWVDERYVPVNSPQSNYKLAADTFLDKVNIPKENIHRIETDLADLNKAALKYEEVLQSVFGLKKGQKPEFDLIILGMGSDGHTASLFPGSYTSLNSDGLASVVYFKNEKLNRITLTPSVLCAAKRLLVLVSGMEKASILHEAMTSNPQENRYPIHLLWPVLDKVTWLVDKEAAQMLI